MQARFPELPKADAAALAEMRTLGQIIASMSAIAPTAEGNAAPVQEAAPAAQTPPVVDAPAAAQAAPQTDKVSLETITQALLEVVSEKTGYPPEMLELDMDMEADLGIDSIKRVEILGAMQARFPELPKADAAALSEQRTLRQVIDFLGQSSPEGTASPLSPGQFPPPRRLSQNTASGAGSWCARCCRRPILWSSACPRATFAW